jgi:hypothetical protein
MLGSERLRFHSLEKIFRSIWRLGGVGRFGMFGRSIFAGWKLKVGNSKSNPTFRSEKSRVMFGILKFGI